MRENDAEARRLALRLLQATVGVCFEVRVEGRSNGEAPGRGGEGGGWGGGWMSGVFKVTLGISGSKHLKQ